MRAAGPPLSPPPVPAHLLCPLVSQLSRCSWWCSCRWSPALQTLPPRAGPAPEPPASYWPPGTCRPGGGRAAGWGRGREHLRPLGTEMFPLAGGCRRVAQEGWGARDPRSPVQRPGVCRRGVTSTQCAPNTSRAAAGPLECLPPPRRPAATLHRVTRPGIPGFRCPQCVFPTFLGPGKAGAAVPAHRAAQGPLEWITC